MLFTIQTGREALKRCARCGALVTHCEWVTVTTKDGESFTWVPVEHDCPIPTPWGPVARPHRAWSRKETLSTPTQGGGG